MMDWNHWLEDGCKALGMQSGSVMVNCGNYLTVVHHIDESSLTAIGDSFPREGTFCDRVMQLAQCITYNAPIDNQSIFRLGKCEIITEIQAYIGFPLIVRDTIFGTINFSSTVRRPDGFSAHDQFLIEMMAGDYVHYNLTPNQARL